VTTARIAMEAADRPSAQGVRGRMVALLRGIMEAILLVLVCLAPWGFGAVEPEFEFVLYAGVAALLGLWGARVLLEWQFRWAKCPVVLCLAALMLLGLWQLVPFPHRALEWLSPGTARLYDQLVP